MEKRALEKGVPVRRMGILLWARVEVVTAYPAAHFGAYSFLFSWPIVSRLKAMDPSTTENALSTQIGRDDDTGTPSFCFHVALFCHAEF